MQRLLGVAAVALLAGAEGAKILGRARDDIWSASEARGAAAELMRSTGAKFHDNAAGRLATNADVKEDAGIGLGHVRSGNGRSET